MKKHDWNLRTVPYDPTEVAEDNRPVVLFAGIFSAMYDGGFMADGFRSAGYAVETFNWQNVRFEEGVEGLHARLIHKAQTCKPDFIFLHIQNADVLTIDTCKELSRLAFTILYTFDVRNSIDWQKAMAPHLDLVLFGDYDSIQECQREGHDNVDYLASSANFMWYRKLPAAPAKIAITQNQFHRKGYQSDRTYRSMGCGCFTVAQYYPDINKDFNSGVLSTWVDFDGLAHECEKYLNLVSIREDKAAAGAQWVRDNHSWQRRVEQLKNLIEKHGKQQRY